MTSGINKILDNLPCPISVAIDTNIVSHAASNIESTVNILLLHRNCRLVVSDTVLAELRNGSPRGELDYLRKSGAVQVRFADDILPDRSVVLRGIDELEVESRAVVDMERFMVDVFRKLANTQSEVDLSGSIIAALNSMADFVESEEVSTLYSSLIRCETSAFESEVMSGGTSKQFFNTENDLKQHGVGASVLRNIRPPDIVGKLLLGASDEVKTVVHTLLDEHVIGPISRNKILFLGVTLAALGFSRDQRIQKKKVEKSIKGGLSQWNDVKHIASCAGSNLFITSDHDCAKLGYAVYEYFSIPTFVALLLQKTSDVELKLLGTEYWP